jgi:ABC-type multidrug transport system permease subunit
MFSLHRFSAIMLKELRHITRDFRIFFLVTLSPAFLLVVLAYLFSFDVGTVNLAWVDGDRTATSRALLAALTADDAYKLVAMPPSEQAVEEMLLSGRADAALFVAPGFETDLERWQASRGATRPAMTLVVIDGTDAITSSQALSGLVARVTAFGARGGAALAALGGAASAAPVIATRIWYNSGLKSSWGMVPGLMALVLILPGLALTLAISREEEVGTFEALIATPVRGAEYLLGKLAAYVASGLISLSLATAVAVLWFGVPLRGSFALLILLTTDFYLACMGLSLLIARVVTSQQTAMLLVLLIFFVPGFFISGLISPVNTSSLPSLVSSYLLPVTHFVAIARGIFLKDARLAALGLHAGLLAATAFLGISASLLLFRKRLG